MKEFRTAMTATLIGLIAAAGVAAQASNDSDLQRAAMQYVPKGMVLAHKPVKGGDKIVVLYKKDETAEGYDGVVLTPAAGGKYDAHKLPAPQFTWSIMEPQAVFFANADSDPANELFIIERCMTGIGPTGAQYFYRTRVYDLKGSEPVHMEVMSDEIGTLRTAAAVRRQLPAIIRRAEARFQPMDVDDMNKKLAGNRSAKTPLQVISLIAEPFDEMQSRTVSIKAASAEDHGELSVVITDDGYMDDSVRGAQYKIKLVKDVHGDWLVSTALKGWRCQAGRGHQDFSSKPCL